MGRTKCTKNEKYRQTRIKGGQRAVRKGFLLSIVSFISCHIKAKRLSCIEAEE